MDYDFLNRAYAVVLILLALYLALLPGAGSHSISLANSETRVFLLLGYVFFLTGLLCWKKELKAIYLQKARTLFLVFSLTIQIIALIFLLKDGHWLEIIWILMLLLVFILGAIFLLRHYWLTDDY